MAVRLQLRVFRAVLDAIETLLREIVPLFRIYAPPWLGYALGLFVLDQLWMRDFQGGYTPDWVAELAFAPFGALITVGVVRWLNEPREHFAYVRLDEVWVWVTGLYALAGIVFYGIAVAQTAWLGLNIDAAVAATTEGSSIGARILWDVIAFLPNWTVTVFAFVMLTPQAAVIVEQGAPSLQRQWQLMRLAPLAILAVAILIGICRVGLATGYASLWQSLLGGFGPSEAFGFGWRRDFAIALWRALSLLPAHFLTDMLALVALARVYKVLAGNVDSR